MVTNLSPSATNTNRTSGYETSGKEHLKTIYMVETTILHTTHTGDGKIEDITTTKHHLDYHIQIVISELFHNSGSTRSANWFHNTSPHVTFWFGIKK